MVIRAYIRMQKNGVLKAYKKRDQMPIRLKIDHK